MGADRHRPTQRPVAVRACAKINLTLRVLATRPDGYHDLRTLFQTVALHDTLTFTAVPGAPFSIDCSDPACPRDRRNLVWRAADALWRAVGRTGEPEGVRVRIVKRIPSQAGLGGASSDAAAALAGLAAAWRVRVSATQRAALGSGLGSDVAFFSEGGRALGVGRGETLFPCADGPSRAVLLVVPSFGVSTVEAYRWWDEWERDRRAAAARPALADYAELEAGSLPADVALRWEEAIGLRLPDAELVNDLQSPVAARHPEIDLIAARLRYLGATVSAMSGSGSVVFGVFATKGGASKAAKALGMVGVRAIVTETIGRADYRRLTRPAFVGR